MRRALAVFLFVVTASAQQPTHVEPPVFVTAIDVVADVRDSSGKLPPGLTAADFVLLEDGVERKVIAVDYLSAERSPVAAEPAQAAAPQPASHRPWQLVLYFENQLSNGPGRKEVAGQMMKMAD